MEDLDRYPWSGHAVLMGHLDFERQEVGEVLERSGGGLTRARERYLRFVGEGIGEGRREDLTGMGKRGRRGQDRNDGKRTGDCRILGDREFSEGLLRNNGLSEKGRVLFSPAELINEVSSILGIEPALVRQQSAPRAGLGYYGRNVLFRPA
jgi:putative transposase